MFVLVFSLDDGDKDMYGVKGERRVGGNGSKSENQTMRIRAVCVVFLKCCKQRLRINPRTITRRCIRCKQALSSH